MVQLLQLLQDILAASMRVNVGVVVQDTQGLLEGLEPAHQIARMSEYSSLLAVPFLQLLWSQALHVAPSLEILSGQFIQRRCSIRAPVAQAVPL